MTFTWTPEFGATVTSQPNVNVVKFGDGYENRVPVGLNFTGESWNVTFDNRDKSEADAIFGFLNTMAGVTAFDWASPDRTDLRRFVCRTWSKSIQRYNLYSVQGTFERVYEP